MTALGVVIKSYHNANFVISVSTGGCHKRVTMMPTLSALAALEVVIKSSWCQLCHHWQHWSLSQKYYHDANFVIAGSTRGCHKIVIMMPTLSALAALEVVIKKLSWCQLFHHWQHWRLSQKCHHDANFVITGSTGGCHKRVIMMPTLSSLAALEVVIMTTSSAASDDRVGIMTTISVLWMITYASGH